MRLSRQLWCGLVWHHLSTLMYSRCFSELAWTKRSDNSRLLKYPRHCCMDIQAWSHTEIVVKRKWTQEFFLWILLWFSTEYTSTNWYPPFFGAAQWGMGMSYRTSPILGLPWMLFQLTTSFPSLTPGCCEPNPLLSSVAGAQGGSWLGPEEPSSACPGSGV